MKLKRLQLKALLISLPVLGLGGIGCSNAHLYALPTTYPTVTLEIQNYCPISGVVDYNYKDIFFYNEQAYFNNYEYVLDTDGDGLPDFFEQVKTNMNLWDINYLYADTNQDGYSDLVQFRLGIPASSAGAMPICQTGYNDSDGDGLTDCEELLIGTQVGASDTDGDGIPDGIEFRFGMDPLDPNDAYIELTGDGYTNYQKVKWGIPIGTYVTPLAASQFPVYTQAAAPNTGGASCSNPINFAISNISIMPVSGYNVFQVKTVEDPQTPVVGGTTYARSTQYLTIYVPSGIKTGSTVLVTTGINSTTISSPTIITPAGGS